MERVAGLQGQWPPSPYIGLWARLESFSRETLEQALRQRRIVKATLMRNTLHLVTARDYATFSSALNGGGASQLDPEAIGFGERSAEQARAFLTEGARSRSEIIELLELEHGLVAPSRQPWRSWFALRVRGHIVHAPESAFWKVQPRTLQIALDDVELPDPDAARIELVRRYLAGFGPATRADIAQWSGLRVRDIAPALEALEPLRRFRDEKGRELLDLPRAPLPGADTPAPARLLPKWDNLLLAHADRRRVLTDERRKVVIRNNGDVAQTFLVDGFVAGTWALADGHVVLDPFGPLTPGARRELRAEARRFESFVA